MLSRVFLVACITSIIFILQTTGNKHICQKSNLQQIEQRISSLSQSHRQPKYSLVKLQYSTVSYHENNNKICDQRKSLIASINIHEGDSLPYPAMIKSCNQYFSLKGHKVVQMAANKQHLVASVRIQFTYFAQVNFTAPIDEQDGLQVNSTVVVKKLNLNNKKTNIQVETVLKIPLLFGKITGFSTSFTLSQRYYAFATSLGYLIFYRIDGKVEAQYNLLELYHPNLVYQTQPWNLTVNIIKLNNHIAVYTTQYNQASFIWTISTNAKNNTMKKYIIPNQQIHKNAKIQLKYNDNNWSEVYVKIGNIIYVYEVKTSLFTSSPSAAKDHSEMPIRKYSLLSAEDQFHITSSMIIVESKLNSINDPYSPFRYYFNVTDGTLNQFRLPPSFCENKFRPYISLSSQALGSHFLCMFCQFSYQCYSLVANADPASTAGKLDYNDYSKFRIPLVLLSLAIVIFISISRGKKSDDKLMEEQKQEQKFMKQLERKDKRLYEELKRNKTTKQFNTTYQPRPAKIQQQGQRMGSTKIY